ncbi:nuclear transport factor 2 family protein [Nocardioides sp.]|uniref:nuclear transport factor 2 family protein n=1 Tax=Nocardioides sp. TaxID=35761 RepID=UPI002ED8F9EA
MDRPEPLLRWHAIAEARDPAGLSTLLADDVTFRSPAVHTPQEGSALTTAYLTAAITVLGPTLQYVREWYDDSSAVLEFRAELEGRVVHGIDMLTWGEDGRLTDFTVMVRPFQGLQKLIELMAAELTRMRDQSGAQQRP